MNKLTPSRPCPACAMINFILKIIIKTFFILNNKRAREGGKGPTGPREGAL